LTRAEQKKTRHKALENALEQNPFLRDEELAQLLGVSIATVRLDRAELGIKEYRERIRMAAERPQPEGDLLDFEPYHSGISTLEPDRSMAYEGSDLIRCQALFSFAENLSLQLVNAKSAQIRVANIKVLRPIHIGERLLAKYEVIREKPSECIVWVKIKADRQEVFRAKISMILEEEQV